MAASTTASAFAAAVVAESADTVHQAPCPRSRSVPPRLRPGLAPINRHRAALGEQQVKRRTKRKPMNDKFDELAKSLAQSVTRRGALKKFGVGLAGVVLASLGLANKAHADRQHIKPKPCGNCKYPYACDTRYPVGSQEFNECVSICANFYCVHPHS